jgi:TonB family protein
MPWHLNQADRLNGYDWRGDLFFIASAVRVLQGAGLLPWETPNHYNEHLSSIPVLNDNDKANYVRVDNVVEVTEVYRLHGVWHFADRPAADLVQTTCSEIPGTSDYKAAVLKKQELIEAERKRQADAEAVVHQEAQHGEAYQVGGGITAPTLLRKVDPEYAEPARKAKLEGSVTLKAIVDAEGNARDISVVSGLGMGLDEKAIEAVRRWKFKPGLKDGKPVNTWASFQLNFVLRK